MQSFFDLDQVHKVLIMLMDLFEGEYIQLRIYALDEHILFFGILISLYCVDLEILPGILPRINKEFKRRSI